MTKKKLLIVVNNEFAANQMVSYLKRLEKNYSTTVIITDLIHSFKKKLKNIKKAFNLINIDKFLYVKKIYSLPKITLSNLFYFFNKIKESKNNLNEIGNFLKRKKINLNDYNEFWFSNDSFSKYIALNYNVNCKFFFHAFMDINNLKIENNIKVLKIKLFNIINKKLIKIIDLNHNVYNGKYLSVIKFTKKNNIFKSPNYINYRDFNYFRKKIYNYKIKKPKLKKIILINAHIPSGYSKNITKDYCIYFSKNIINYLNEKKLLKDYSIILKSKAYTKHKYTKYLIYCFKKYSKKNDIYDKNDLSKNEIPIDVLADILKPKIYITMISTADWIISINNPNTKIINNTKMFLYYWNNIAFKFRTSLHKQNHKNLIDIYKHNYKNKKLEISDFN